MYGFRMKQSLANKTPRLAYGRKQVEAHDVISSNNLSIHTCLELFALRQERLWRSLLPVSSKKS
ncbi:hypothetical protein C427_0035 [Paraglaciecola psychrophila 170]|uniref:Uncharacterized protein n=1 Tax=Paraglaciecola psychrophila 170 TaxID=1129794 RepID=K6ZVE2_9ALTE|nr:hypothetical protein C427_0035 [Paraglaciecola psychrophila 170]GAC39831.1 hypothetical protein GPSY_4220 [Paraglaciecola psychrophila 170]